MTYFNAIIEEKCKNFKKCWEETNGEMPENRQVEESTGTNSIVMNTTEVDP